eukprot:364715-Chlamydomonas_euryale.AAC.2
MPRTGAQQNPPVVFLLHFFSCTLLDLSDIPPFHYSFTVVASSDPPLCFSSSTVLASQHKPALQPRRTCAAPVLHPRRTSVSLAVPPHPSPAIPQGRRMGGLDVHVEQVGCGAVTYCTNRRSQVDHPGIFTFPTPPALCQAHPDARVSPPVRFHSIPSLA